jgi:TFIIF-interacting CTD phosphatase-like protein
MLTSSSPPFLPQIETNYIYTLVLDLDETLIHHFYVKQLFNQIVNSGILLMRPGALEFLKDLSGKFELVIFTAATKEVFK